MKFDSYVFKQEILQEVRDSLELNIYSDSFIAKPELVIELLFDGRIIDRHTIDKIDLQEVLNSEE